MALSEARLKALKPKQRPYKVADRAGLYALISPTTGAPAWKFNYTLNGKQKTLSLGRWPAVSLHTARDLRDQAQRALAEGRDPAVEKQERKRARTPDAAPTFEQKAREWHAARLPEWTDAYARQVLTRLEDDVFPLVGAKEFADITRADLHAVLEQVERRGVGETVRRLRQYIGAIYRFAGARDESITDPTPFLREGRKSLPEVVHHAMVPMNELGAFQLRVAEYDGEAETRLAIQLTLLTCVRTMEMLGAEWSEFRGWQTSQKVRNDAMWTIPGERMKKGDPHMVPLSPQACDLLSELHELTGEGRFLFPIARSTPGRRVTMSNNAMLFALYRLGYRGRATVHGLRRNFSTWANENDWPKDDVELCLAHDERDRVRGAYNAAQRLEPRRKLLRAWADHLDRERKRARREM